MHVGCAGRFAWRAAARTDFSSSKAPPSFIFSGPGSSMCELKAQGKDWILLVNGLLVEETRAGRRAISLAGGRVAASLRKQAAMSLRSRLVDHLSRRGAIRVSSQRPTLPRPRAHREHLDCSPAEHGMPKTSGTRAVACSSLSVGIWQVASCAIYPKSAIRQSAGRRGWPLHFYPGAVRTRAHELPMTGMCDQRFWGFLRCHRSLRCLVTSASEAKGTAPTAAVARRV